MLPSLAVVQITNIGPSGLKKNPLVNKGKSLQK